MQYMFAVRAPPSRVLLFLRRRVVVARSLYPRSEIAVHSARPPVPRCAVECLCLQSAHRCMEREEGDGHAGHVRCTCSSIMRVAALASLCRRHRPSPISSLRDRCSLRTAARPSLRCREPMPSIRTSASGASNRFRRSLLISTPVLHSHGLRRTSRNGGIELWPAVPRKDASGSTTMSRQRYQGRCSDFT
jgi:hypothetical protein